GDELRQRVPYDVAQELALPVPEGAPAEQPVLHAAPHPVVVPVQHQQAVGHDDAALVVERLLQVAQPECLAYVGVTVKGDRRHRLAPSESHGVRTLTTLSRRTVQGKVWLLIPW